MSTTPASVFAALRELLLPLADELVIVHDQPDNFYLDTAHVMKNGKPLFFGAVRISKNYVGFHLMPVYVNPGLLKNISPDLRKRMQGKSCFNFKGVDEALFYELGQLVQAGFEDYRRQGYV